MRLERDVPLGPLTTLKLGGKASHVAVIERESDVPDALREAERLGVPPFVLGGGSNLVVGDDGVDALVLRMALLGRAVSLAEGIATVTLAAGEPWDPFVAFAVGEGLSGVECLGGIPGLVGATPIQNVGAYGQEVKDTIVSVRAFDREARVFVDLRPADCEFGYRHSRLKTTSRFVVVAATFELQRKDESAPVRYAELSKALGIADGGVAPVARVHETVVALRRTKGMVLDAADSESVSAGSFFVNPVVDDNQLATIAEGARAANAGEVPRHAAGEGKWKVPAAWLIERAGFTRGFTQGHVRVSKRHTLALVNDGGTTRELLALAHVLRGGVRARFGVSLTHEPVLLGCSFASGDEHPLPYDQHDRDR